MELNDLILVSVDDHAVEPPDMFLHHIPAAYKDVCPKIESKDGVDTWVYEGQRLPNIGLNAVVGRPANEYGCEPAAFSQMRKGCYDVKARVEDMSANGVLGSMCFATFPGFAGSLFLSAKDKTAAEAIIRAYNDWHIDEWCGSAPGRFIPMAILPLWDIDMMVKEARRVAAKGCHSISFPDNPAAKGLPSLHNDYWDPLWKVLSENKIVICCHIGTGVAAPHASMDSPIDAWITTMPISIVNSAADWLFAPVFKKFPDLRMALSEGGIGWIPYFLERANFTYKHHKAWTNADFGKELPSDLFNRNVISCFIDDNFGLQNLDKFNVDMVTWECDYPHSDTVWPKCPEYLWSGVKSMAPEVVNKITHLNAMREFSYDPFSILGRENCTVGALRQQAAHVDVSLMLGLGGHNPVRNDGKPVTSGQIVKMFTSAVE